MDESLLIPEIASAFHPGMGAYWTDCNTILCLHTLGESKVLRRFVREIEVD